VLGLVEAGRGELVGALPPAVRCPGVAGDDLAFHQRLQLRLGDLRLGPRVDLGHVLDLPTADQRARDHGPDELGDQLPLHHVSQPDGDASLDAR
jgi:hypothetical protein